MQNESERRDHPSKSKLEGRGYTCKKDLERRDHSCKMNWRGMVLIQFMVATL